MGSGRWSTDVYDAAARYRAATGTSAFAHSDSGASTVHPDLDPHGARCRESRDSAEHPRSLAIAVLFDVTGSMRDVPRVLQAKLPQLLGLLLRKGYADDPQIMFGAIGDATCDRAPLQVGQFESDNRMDDDLSRILLEGGGGGQLGLGEDAISLGDGLADLDDVGSDAAPAVSKALAAIGSAPTPAMISVSLDDLDGPSGNARL